MTPIDAEALRLLAGALDRDGPDTRPDARAPGDAWLMAKLAARLDPEQAGDPLHDPPHDPLDDPLGYSLDDQSRPGPATTRLAQRLARRSRADLRDLMSSPRLEAKAVRTHLSLDEDELLPAVTRALTQALALRSDVAAVLAAMILRDAAQASRPGLAAVLRVRTRDS